MRQRSHTQPELPTNAFAKRIEDRAEFRVGHEPKRKAIFINMNVTKKRQSTNNIECPMYHARPWT
jgi:hypothetical protein